MYYELPLYGVNVIIWKYLGFIEFENFYRSVPLIVVVVLTVFGQVNFILVHHELSGQVMSLFMTAIMMNSLVRIITVMKNQAKFIKFMTNIESWYNEAELSNDRTAWNILKKLPLRAGAISKFSLSFGCLGAAINNSIPFLVNHRSLFYLALPYDVHFFGIDVFRSPVYEIVLALELFVVAPFIVCSYIPFTNLFISWLIFGIHLLKILRKKLEELPSGDDKDQLKHLKAVIRYHKRIIRFGRNLQDLVSFVCMAELLLFTMMLSVLLVCTLLVENTMFQVATVVYTLSILYALFISYWHANEFSSQSVKIADAVYNIDWTNSSIEVRRCVLILIVRCQTSLKISAGGIYPMTLETFQALLNAAYTYFNMARGFMGK